MGGRRFWNLVRLRRSGHHGSAARRRNRTVDQRGNRPLAVRCRQGSPETDTIVIVMPDATSCDNVVEQWCPQVNFIEDEQTARSWLHSKGLVAEVVPVAEASRRGAAAWATVVDAGSDSPWITSTM